MHMLAAQEPLCSEAVRSWLAAAGMSAACVELIEGLLRPRQTDRLSFEDALNHAWLRTA